MRFEFSEGKQKEFLQDALLLSNKTQKEFAKNYNIPKSTLQKWIYEDRLLPSEIFDFITKEFLTLTKYKKWIIEEKPDNWGRVIGGKEAYKSIVKKYGKKEIVRRRKKAIKNSLLAREEAYKNFALNLEDKHFLEFYGALIGDGWTSALKYKKKKRSYWWVGISGNLKLDRQYHSYLTKLILKLFSKSPMVKEYPKSNSRYLIFCHKPLIILLKKTLKFPTGRKKEKLSLPNKIRTNWHLLKHVIRGIFDTDGSLYFDKTPAKKPYPVISISMRQQFLLNQIRKQLLKQGFKVRMRENELILKGNKQLQKWMQEIGSSNDRHYLKYKKWIEDRALVAQLDSATAS